MPEKYTRPGSHERVANVERMKQAGAAERDALATVRVFNSRLSTKRAVWFSPKITAATTAKHPWLIIACDSCGTVVDLDLRVKPRDPEASVLANKELRWLHARCLEGQSEV